MVGARTYKGPQDMAANDDIAVVLKTYSGVEGQRVKAGTRFAIGKEIGGLPVITKSRYEALRQNKIVRKLADDDLKPRRGTYPLARKVIMEEGAGGLSAQAARNKVRGRLATKKQDAEPSLPKQVSGPRAGSRTGAEKSESSSEAGHPLKPLTSKNFARRGQRGAPAVAPAAPSASSPSTTPTR
jgi:hypothetical protein